MRLCWRLAEHLGQAHRGHPARGDHVGQHRPRPHRRELVDVAHQHQLGPGGQRLDQVGGQPHVEHRGLVDDQHVGLDGALDVAGEAAVGRAPLEQPVQGARPAGRSSRTGAWPPARSAPPAPPPARPAPGCRRCRARWWSCRRPGPPVMTTTWLRSTCRIASACWRASSSLASRLVGPQGRLDDVVGQGQRGGRVGQPHEARRHRPLGPVQRRIEHPACRRRAGSSATSPARASRSMAGSEQLGSTSRRWAASSTSRGCGARSSGRSPRPRRARGGPPPPAGRRRPGRCPAPSPACRPTGSRCPTRRRRAGRGSREPGRWLTRRTPVDACGEGGRDAVALQKDHHPARSRAGGPTPP